jgi:hypothetical protein
MAWVEGERVLSSDPTPLLRRVAVPVSPNLHSPERQLIELRIEHADLDAMVDRFAHAIPVDELLVQRLKKRRLALRDRIERLQWQLEPKEPA